MNWFGIRIKWCLYCVNEIKNNIHITNNAAYINASELNISKPSKKHIKIRCVVFRSLFFIDKNSYGGERMEKSKKTLNQTRFDNIFE